MDNTSLADKRQITPTRAIASETYVGLRNEIVKRLDIRYQLINYNLAAFAALLALGLNSTSDTPTMLFVYPMVSAGLTAAWVDNHLRLKQIGDFLSTAGYPWERYLRMHGRDRLGKKFLGAERLGELSIAAIFPGTQLVSFVGGVILISLESLRGVDCFLILFSFFSIVMTFFALISGRDK